MRNKILILSLTALLFHSCKIEIDDNFDKSASERMDAVKKEFSDYLTSSQTGWVIEYYPGESRPYGGYVMLAKFEEDGTVTVASQVSEDLSRTVSSSYSINGSQSAVLSFDGYNELMHFWADPEVTEGAGASVGYGGDFEFVYYSGSPQEIITQGKKRHSVTRFTKFPEDTSWSQYLQDVVDLEDQMLFSSYNLVVGDQTVVMTLDPNGYQVLKYNDPEEPNPDIYTFVPFIYTNKGMKLYEPLNMFGEEVMNFEYDAADQIFRCTDPGTTAQIICKMSETYIYYQDLLGSYTMHYAEARGGEVNLTVDVTLVQDVENASFLLKGLLYDVYVGYNKSAGTIYVNNLNGGRSIPGYTYQGYPVAMCLMNDAGSFNHANTTYGMVSENSWNEGEKEVLTLVDNDVAWKAESIMFIYYTIPGTTSSRVYLYPRYYGPLKLVKN